MPVKQPAHAYLTFQLNNECFAIGVDKVLEILEMQQVTKVPQSPPFMKGVINLRGNILPVIDLRAKFEMIETVFTVDTCIIVVSIDVGKEPVLAGALVDGVNEVIEIPEGDIHPSPGAGFFSKADFITGMGKAGEKFIMILDPDKVFSTSELLAGIAE